MELTVLSLAFGVVLPVVLLWPLERLSPAHRGQPFWRADSRLDVIYWASLLTFRGLLTGLVIGSGVLLGMEPDGWFRDGFGPLARQPGWLQVVEFLILFDLASYWVHRYLHGRRLWRFHAIHHSSTRPDWLSTVRHHPVNDVAMRAGQALPAILLGFSPQVILWSLPALTFHSLLVHANLNWTFGPFHKLIASPAYHRWHHTSQAEAQDKNFAELSPVWDILFGTYYMPADRRPERYGLHDRSFPGHFWGQMLYPFQRRKKPVRRVVEEPRRAA